MDTVLPESKALEPIYMLVAHGVSLHELDTDYSYSDMIGVIRAIQKANK